MKIHHCLQSTPPIATNSSENKHIKRQTVLYFTILAGEAVWPDMCSWIFRLWRYEYALGTLEQRYQYADLWASIGDNDKGGNNLDTVWWTECAQANRSKHACARVYAQLTMSMINTPSALKKTFKMKSIEHSKFEQNQTELSCQREAIWYCISVIFRVSLGGLFLLCPWGTLSVTIFFICAMQYLHVWCLLKCVNSDNAPYCPSRGCRDIAILCLRCRKARKKRCI